MIPVEKDRLDCLRLAVSIVIPRHTVGTKEAGTVIIELATKFYEFISKDEPRK